MKPARLLVAVVLLCGCSRSSAGDAPSTSASAGTSAGPAASTSGAPASSASGGATASAQRAWHGAYKSIAAPSAVQPRTHPVDPDPSAGVGAGNIALNATGDRVTGSLDGVLGPAVIDGTITGDRLSAAVLRKDASDRGFAGTFVATLSGAEVDGAMTLSSGQAASIRTATFTLVPGAGP
jgi:hypothetical protein